MIPKWELAVHWYANKNQLIVKNLDGLGNNVLWLFGWTNIYGLTVAEWTKCTVQAQQHANDRNDVVFIQIREMLLHMQLQMYVLISVTGENVTEYKVKAESI